MYYFIVSFFYIKYLRLYYMELDSIIEVNQGVFLIFLVLAGTYIKELLSCSVRELIDNNIMAKQFIVFLMIFFAVTYTNKNNINPTFLFAKAVGVYLFYLVFMKQIPFTFYLILNGILILYVSDLYKKFEDQRKNNKNKKFLENMQKICLYLIILVAIIGFFLYMEKQYTDHKETFKFAKFIFGTVKCDYVVGE